MQRFMFLGMFLFVVSLPLGKARAAVDQTRTAPNVRSGVWIAQANARRNVPAKQDVKQQDDQGKNADGKQDGDATAGMGKTTAERKRQPPKDAKFTFEFSKADLMDIVKLISEKTGKNFIVPEKLKSQKLTILSPTTINLNEAYQVFQAALAVNGVTLIRTGKFYKLVESKEAIKSTIPTCIGTEDQCPKYSEQMVTQLIHLSHVEASQINPVLSALISKEGEVTIFQPSNALIVSEWAPNLERVKRIITALDIPGFDDELQIVQIEHATAPEIASKISEIFEVQANRSGRGMPNSRSPANARNPNNNRSNQDDGSDDVQISKIIADERTNQIIIKANRRSFDAIKGLIGKLDVPIGDQEGGIHVYYLEHASAEDLSSTLSSLAQGSGTQNTTQRRSQPRQTTPSQANRPTETAVLFQGEVKITADGPTNSLIVIASPSDYRGVAKLIEKLDVPRRQVYVEAAILEVTVNNSRDIGLNWHAPFTFGDGAVGRSGIGFLQSAQGDSSSKVSPTLADLSNPASLLG
ncbi:MAG: secretin N-terminal domain-containing protein, partial [Myxococcota bacterium]